MVAPEAPWDSELQSPLQPGQILAGKYRVERQIGRGGMGIVLAATHLQLEHLVAIKVLRRDLLEDDKALGRLLSEARAAAKIRSEHVARVLDVGTLENGSPFIVMEYLEGEDLADLLDRQGALEVTQAVQFLLQSCEALAEVHAAEMVHRDLKPGNLFLAKLPDGSHSLKIVDFGISKHIGGSARNQAATTSAQVLGSPYYMPPEQMRAEPVDERSDIWSLGAILFEMLTARPPFLGETLPEVYAAVLGQPAPSIESLRMEVPAGLDDIVQRCLDKDPAQRFCDVADLAEALAPFGGPASATSVDRITRILTNPDLFRGRSSAAPKPALAAELPAAAGTARGGISLEPAMAGTPVVDVGGASALSPLLARPGSWPAALEPRAFQPRRAGSSPSELGPLSATGSLADLEPPRGARGARAAWAALALLTLLVVLVLWMRPRPAPVAQPAAAPAPLVAAPYRDSTSGLEGGEPAAQRKQAEAPVRPAASTALETSRQALKPALQARAPTVSVVDSRAAVAGRRAAVSERSEHEEKDKKKSKGKAPAAKTSASASNSSNVAPKESQARPDSHGASETAAPPPASQNPGSSRAGAGARDADPWNPSTFGDRQ
jgi:serine/threonine protein kinase